MTLLMIEIGAAGIAAVAGLFFVLAAISYIVFRMLRKTVKMAFRMAVVAAVLVTFVVGGIALYWFGTGSTEKPSRPERSRQR